MKAIMMSIAVTVLSLGSAIAHDSHHDHESMKSTAPLSGASVWQLESQWKDDNGKQTKLASLAGKPQLVAMVYTRCKTACPTLVENIREVTKGLGKKSDRVGVTLFSFDSDSDTPTALSEFRKARKIPSDWHLLTSNSDAVSELAHVLGVRYKKLKNGEYVHSNVIYLLGSKGDNIAKLEGLNASNKQFIKKIEKTI